MALEAILGELIKAGLGGPAEARMRQGASAGGLEDALGALLGAAGGGSTGGRAAAPAGGLGDLAASVDAMLSGGSIPRPGGGAAQGGGASGGMGGGLGDLLGAVLGGAGPDAAPRAPGGGAAGGGSLGDLLGAALGGAAGRSSGGAGGLGDLLGAVLGGAGGRSSVGGGAAMAVLGSLALQAFKAWQASAGAAAADAQRAMQEQAPTVVDGDAAALVVRAMLNAAKADGKLDKAEVERLTAKLNEDGETTADERAMIDAELARPADPQALAALARGPAQAAQVYAASIMAIEIDTEPERAYLRALAQALRLPPQAVAELHRMTGATAV